MFEVERRVLDSRSYYELVWTLVYAGLRRLSTIDEVVSRRCKLRNRKTGEQNSITLGLFVKKLL